MVKSTKETKREMIMEAAIHVFSHKGYHNTKMEEIAAAAGIGKGTIYEYFPSKLQLLREIMQHSLDVYYRHFSVEELERLSFDERIQVLLEVHFRFCQENADLTKIIFWDVEIVDGELKDWIMQLRKDKEAKMENIIQNAINSGELRPVDAKMLTLMIMGVMGSIWLPLAIERRDIDVSEAAREVADMFMHGVKNNAKSKM